MLPPSTLIPLDESNIQHLDQLIRSRWARQRKYLLMAFLLPLPLLVIPVVFIFVYAIVVIVSLANLQKRLGGLYADRKAGQKRVIPFHPYPYCIPDVDRYYIKTNIIDYPYISIDRQTYYWMNSDQVLYMELGPKSKILFNITAQEAPEFGQTDPALKTPSQLKDRNRWN